MDEKPKLLGIIGHPIGHSLSPLMHNYLLKEIGVSGYYHAFDVDGDGFSGAVVGLKVIGCLGFNVTIPFKQRIIAYLDEIEEPAQFIGAVNTVAHKNGKYIGLNTDSKGLTQALNSNGVQLKKKNVAVLGAGGAARAAINSLHALGAENIYIFNRTLDKAKTLAETYGSLERSQIVVEKLHDEAIGAVLSDCDLLVNATSVGMWPYMDFSPMTFGENVPGLVAVDVIYNPLETKFLRLARLAGATVIDGLDMFIYQGLESLKIWLDLNKDLSSYYEALRNLLTEELRHYGNN